MLRRGGRRAVDKIPSPETRTELFEGATEGPYEWSDAYEATGDRATFSLTGEGGAYGILSCDGMANSPQNLGPSGQANSRLLAASWTLLRERDTLLARLEGRAELPEGYEFDPFMDIAGSHISLMVTGYILLSLYDTPTNRRILTAMAWAHWHATGAGK
jgi:hypothetical protein